jgi:hypothetical protein
MFSALIRGASTRRGSRPTIRRSTMSRRPQLEEMEGRQLLTTFITINNPSVVEGTGVNSTMKFTVSLATPSTVPVTVAFQTVNQRAMAGSDYDSTNGTLTFNPGETAKLVPVTVVGDRIVEPNKTFGLLLSNATNATIINSTGVGTIIDDDTAVTPTLSINDVTTYRGLSGSKTMTFTVSLNTALSYPVTVNAATSNLSAIAGVDYAAKSQTLTFAAGQTTAQFSVTIYGTSIASADKIFCVKLTNGGVAISRTIASGILKFGA